MDGPAGIHLDRLIDAMRSINYEIRADMSTMEANAILIETIHEKLQRLEERLTFLEPHEED